MQITFSRCDQIERFNTDACVIFIASREKKIVYPQLPESVDIGDIDRFVKKIKDPAGFGKIFYFALPGDKNPRLRIVAGVGEPIKLTEEKLRRIGGKIYSSLQKHDAETACLQPPSFKDIKISNESIIRSLSEGLLLSDYDFEVYKQSNDDKNKPVRVKHIKFVQATASRKFGNIINDTQILVEGINFVRDLVNEPGNNLNPDTLKKIAQKDALKNKYRLKILSVKDLQRLKMNALLSVGQGSKYPPYILELTHNSKHSTTPPVILIGKGITFDTGGISIKPAKDMYEMKGDMAGAATVLGIFHIISKIAPKMHVKAIIPVAENMPGPNATRPGDIVRASNGKTIEILNTDAEGRLILADAIAYAHKFKPSVVIDLATLTGACIVALGHSAAGLFSNHNGLVTRLVEIGEKTGERLWRLPLWKTHLESVKGNITDLKNIGHPPGAGGAIVGAAFLYHFVNKIPWAHIDIAGTSWRNCPNEYMGKGGSGFGVRLLASFLQSWTPLDKENIELPD